ncbi:Gfo/Idh/MocA family oxidoreductase [Candidatus Pelagibacter sp.]|nr:Gfo/Idh/MocA family oxidoreductase [Candidatus Pelagibacter sp.]
MYSQKNKVVLIGSGYWGTNIANNLVKLGVEKFYIFDVNHKNLITLKKRFPNKIEIIKDINTCYSNSEYKYFIYATPPSINYRLIKNALKNNKYIFIEKPGFKNLNEINKLILKYPIASNRMMFGYIYTFNNYVNYIKKFCNDKKNGKILYMKFQRQNLGPIRNDVNVSYDLSSHDISIIKYIFPKKKLKIIKNQSYKLLNSRISDISNLSFKIDNTFIDINNSWINPDKIRRIIIITKKRMLLFDEMLVKDKLKIFNKYASYPKIEMLKNNFFNRKIKIFIGKNFTPRLKANDTLKDEIKHFLKFNSKKNKFCNVYFAKEILKILADLKKMN